MADAALIQSLVRGLDILTLVAESPDGLRLNALADATGLKLPTVHKLARTLVHRGFLARASRPVRYQLGRAALEIAEAHWHSNLLRRAPDVLRRICSHFGRATATLCEVIGGEVINVLRMSPERPGVVERPVSRAMMPYSSASALVFQAWWTEQERSAYRDRYPFWEHGAHLWTDVDALDTFLAETREKGCASAYFLARNCCPAAAPVFGPNGVLRATVGASVPMEDSASHTDLIQTVLYAARELVPADEATPQP